jgi:hypothetical protein
MRPVQVLSTTILLLTTMGAAAAPAPSSQAWFQQTEQALLDAVAVGDRGVWEKTLADTWVGTSEEGEVLTKAQLLKDLSPLPPGLSGHITVRDLTVQETASYAIVRYVADEAESVFGQSLAVRYRTTDTFERAGTAWTMVASHTSVITQDPPAQTVSSAGWPALVGSYRLLPAGWTFKVALKDGALVGGREGSTPRPLVPLSPTAFVQQGRLGEWLFVVEDGRATRIVNVRKFAVLVWTRVES